MELDIKSIPNHANEWTVKRTIATVVHSEEFEPIVDEKRLLNFRVKLNPNPAGGVRNDGTGLLIFPTATIGNRFLLYTRNAPLYIDNNKLRFYRRVHPPRNGIANIAELLRKTPYLDPDLEEERQNKKRSLEDKLRIDAVQFGLFYRPKYPSSDKEKLAPRSFSVEWERDYRQNSAWLHFDYDHKRICIDLGNDVTDIYGYRIVVNFASIQRIAVGYDGYPYICFDTLTPPIFEMVKFHRTLTGANNVDSRKFRQRVGAIHEGHAKVAAYAMHLRLVLYNRPDRDIIQVFEYMCKTAGLIPDSEDVKRNTLIIECHGDQKVEALRQGFFDSRRLYKLYKALAKFEWPVAFQLESLRHNGLLNTDDLDHLLDRIRDLIQKQGSGRAAFVGGLLRRYSEALQGRTLTESPLNCFQRILERFEFLVPTEAFRCYHVTFTPTRMLLEGPYASQSNRVIRQYAGFEDHFIRVDFRDEDRLQYRWDREVDGSSFLAERVGGTLKNGFELAGRRFEFLAYSTSALRQHAVWFMNPFYHPDKNRIIDAAYIRDSLGNFKGTELLQCPSKYAARLAQAFTATDPSVGIRKSEWEEMPDMGTEPYLFTDGVGTISKALGNRIWNKICETRHMFGNPIQPSAYQIRFLGYKGVVAVDEQLDLRKDGIHMRLRPSMRKFEANDEDIEIAPIEIARAFETPNICYLNRPLVMLLEDIGVRRQAFQDLQDAAVADARTIDDSLSHFCNVLSSHDLGSPYRIREVLGRLRDRYNMDLRSNGRKTIGIDGSFLRQVRQVAMIDILRDIKHSARIPVPDSYLLVGVADEGPAYAGLPGYKNVYCLSVNEIYVCIQRPQDPKPIWLEGNVSISRSPVVHPGDVRRVRAIGKPPRGQLCLFEHLKNVVVMASVGPRSLASMLGGGDVDGDLFSVICHDPLLPSRNEDPASYTPLPTKRLKRDSTVEDICDFVVEYIDSDLLGLLSDKLLVIADQSIQGMHDERCKWLAELCSQAVDYPKQGTAPDTDGNNLPRPLIPCKPDWHAAEVVSPRKTDYYASSKALGYLFRSITVEEEKDVSNETAPPVELLSDPISRALLSDVQLYIGNSALVKKPSVELLKLFQRYSDELRYICATHTLSNTPKARLLEAEIVVGTIIAKCSQKRWRKDRMYRMRLHAASLVKDVRAALLANLDTDSVQELISSLERAWGAWDLSLRYRNQFGANSFSFIALGAIFDCLDKLAKF